MCRNGQNRSLEVHFFFAGFAAAFFAGLAALAVLGFASSAFKKLSFGAPHSGQAFGLQLPFASYPHPSHFHKGIILLLNKIRNS
jgi:hypothetical protein